MPGAEFWCVARHVVIAACCCSSVLIAIRVSRIRMVHPCISPPDPRAGDDHGADLRHRIERVDPEIVDEGAEERDARAGGEARGGEVETPQRRDEQHGALGGEVKLGLLESHHRVIGVGGADDGGRRGPGAVRRACQPVGRAQGEQGGGVGENGGCGEEGQDDEGGSRTPWGRRRCPCRSVVRPGRR